MNIDKLIDTDKKWNELHEKIQESYYYPKDEMNRIFIEMMIESFIKNEEHNFGYSIEEIIRNKTKELIEMAILTFKNTLI